MSAAFATIELKFNSSNSFYRDDRRDTAHLRSAIDSLKNRLQAIILTIEEHQKKIRYHNELIKDAEKHLKTFSDQKCIPLHDYMQLKEAIAFSRSIVYAEQYMMDYLKSRAYEVSLQIKDLEKQLARSMLTCISVEKELQ